MSDFAGITVLAVFAGSAAIGAGRKILERRRARRELRETAPLTAASPEGNVLRVTGVVRAAESVLTAPLSGRECVVVRSRVVSGRALTSRAQRPAETMAMVPFVIDRGADGIVRIEGEHVLLDLAPLELRRKDIELDRQYRFLAKHGYARRDTRRAIFEETIVAVGMRVSVAGLMMKDVVDEPVVEGERGFRDDKVATTLRLAGNVEHPIVIGEPV